MFKQISLALAAFGAVSAAHAMADARLHTCGDIQEGVAYHGALVVRTGDFTYERIVRDASFCSNAGDETTRPAWIETSDGLCTAGYRCVQDNRGGNGG